MKKIAVFASGNGSNFQSLVDAQKEGKLIGKIQILISDKENSFVVERAQKENISVFTFNPKEFLGKKEYEKKIIEVLEENSIDLIVLAGYMRIVGQDLLTVYRNKIINLHPSLLPAFPGKAAIEQAFIYGVKIAGVTIHFVDEGMDTGPIISQKAIIMEEKDSLEALTKKIHEIEHQLLLETINTVLQERVEIIGRNVLIKEN